MKKSILAGIAASAVLAGGVLLGNAYAQSAGISAGTKADIGTPSNTASTSTKGTASASGSTAGGRADQRASSDAGTHTGTHSGANPTVGAAPGHSDPSRTKADRNGKMKGTGTVE
jgi:hypothetical protein